MAPRRIQTVADIRSAVSEAKSQGQSVGFVPTMGFLHEGHGSLIRQAKEENDVVVMSIFVNPLQFTDQADLATYPRDTDRDDAIANDNGADLIFSPEVVDMYPTGEPATEVSVSGVTEVWEGRFRPGHFDGVTFVVAKLFNIVLPDRAYFGEKDFQQLATVRQMVVDLSIPCDIVGCPIIRDPDGLALSGRNSRRSTEERQKALVLSAALKAGRQAFLDGSQAPEQAEHAMRHVLATEPGIDVDYAVAVDCETLEPATDSSVPFQLLVAARIGDVRLIDNIRVGGPPTSELLASA